MENFQQSDVTAFLYTVYICHSFPTKEPLLISWLQSPSAMILEPPKIKSVCFHFPPFYLSRSDGTRCHDLDFFFACWVSNQLFHSPLSPSRGSLVLPLISAIRVISSVYLRLLTFFLAILILVCDSSSLAFCIM